MSQYFNSIYYIVNECIAADIIGVFLVMYSSKNVLNTNCLMKICPEYVTILHVCQGVAKDLGHAVLKARPIIGHEPFVVVVPGVVLDDATVI